MNIHPFMVQLANLAALSIYGAAIGEKFHEETKLARTAALKGLVTPRPAIS